MTTGMSIRIIGTGTIGKRIVQMLAQSENVSSVIWKGRTVEGT